MQVSEEIQLPQEFCSRMQEILGKEYKDYLESFQKPRTFGLRVNTSKISCEEFERLAPFPIRKIPWMENGYFYEAENRPAHCPYYQAGLYYLQEPSAMTPAFRLPVFPGEAVLDLCAAPGGKATALGDRLRGKGLLVANDISTSRARALLRNLELFGITNSFVSNEAPARLATRFPEFFHKILLDAPCSGEGMFRKEAALLRDWTPQKSQELSEIQKDLILQAADMLRPGGMLLYSTCTFSPQEDEQVITHLLNNRPQMQLVSMPGYAGFSPGFPDLSDGNPDLKKCVRIFPHKMEGEGHFLALLAKGEPLTPPDTQVQLFMPKQQPNFSTAESHPTPSTVDPRLRPSREAGKWISSFWDEIGLHTLSGEPFDDRRVEVRNDKVYYLPPAACDFQGIHFMRNGLYLGDLKKKRFEPSQPLALALHRGDVERTLSLSAEDSRLNRYLRGETLTLRQGESSIEKGWLLLCVDGYPLGFAKQVGTTLKNKIPSGWRVL